MNKFNVVEWWRALDDEWKRRFIELSNLEHRNHFVNRSFDKAEDDIRWICSSITKLRLTKLKRVAIPDLTPMVNLTQICFSHIEEIECLHLSTCSKLSAIEFWCVPIADLSFLQYSPNVKKINLFSTSVENLDPVKHCKGLLELRFCKHSLDGETRVTSLEALESLKDLRVLHVGQDISHIDTLVFLPLLEEFSYWSLDDVSFLSKNKNLKKIFPMGDEKSEFSTLTGFSQLSSLEYLDVSNSNVTDLDELKNLRFLKTIVLRSTPLHRDYKQFLKRLFMRTKIQKFRKTSKAEIRTSK